VIIRNSARCLDCGDHIESLSQHHLAECSCGNIFVDGGHAYLRHGYTYLTTYEDTSIVTNELDV